jgi:lipopolysaccharide transport system permease protein
MTQDKPEQEWDLVVKPKGSVFDVKLKEILKYSDLLFLLVRRDFSAQFKQTLLGPLLLFIQPLATTIVYTVFFGAVAKVGTDGMPRILFYLSGLTLWTYFSDSLIKTSGTFVSNANIFGKVYFPRLIIPLSILVSNLIKLLVLFILFMAFWLYYYFTADVLHPHFSHLYLLPVLIIIIAGLALGVGIFISSITTKYRDLAFLVGFGVQLLMYASSVIIPLSRFPENVRKYILLNPVCSIIETFKYIFLGSGDFSWLSLLYSFCFMMVLLFFSILAFNKAEKSFIDTV